MPFGKSPACFCSCFLLLLVKIAFWRRGARRAPRTVIIASMRCAQPSSVHRALSAITRGTQSLNAEEGFYLADRSTCRISGRRSIDRSEVWNCEFQRGDADGRHKGQHRRVLNCGHAEENRQHGTVMLMNAAVFCGV